jgi:hypothetical protein
MTRYRYDPVHYNEDCGVNYLEGLITEQEFKIKLQRSDKRMQMAREILNVLEMYQTTVTDMVDRYRDAMDKEEPVGEIKTPEDCESLNKHFKILEEVYPLIEYANECLAKIAHVYSSKSPVVLEVPQV